MPETRPAAPRWPPLEPEPPTAGLDPELAPLIEALAIEAARRDHEAANPAD